MSIAPEPSDSRPQNPPRGGRLFTFRSGGWVLLLSGFFTLVAAGLVLYPVYMSGGFHPPRGDGVDIDTYGFDLSNLTLPRERLIASGNSKDQIRAIPAALAQTITPADVDLIARHEHIRFLVPSDRVIGVVIEGEARAYPLRVLSRHELVNDRVAGIPLAVTYAPLCDSALVFDRRIDGNDRPAVEFGISGLLVDSNTVYFDRRSDTACESLWPQLALKAISGPSADRKMILIPYELTTWGQWLRDHSDTRVLQGLRTLRKAYGKELYNTYYASDELKFPVSAIWHDPRWPRKTPIVVTSTDGIRWTASSAQSATSGLATPAEYRVHTSLFAWYAQHHDHTDFSALDR